MNLKEMYKPLAEWKFDPKQTFVFACVFVLFVTLGTLLSRVKFSSLQDAITFAFMLIIGSFIISLARDLGRFIVKIILIKVFRILD